MDKKEFLKKYFNDFKKIIDFDSEKINNLIKVSELLQETNKKRKKTMIFGNGGSAAMASHFSVDLTKNARVRCVNYNESDLLTCFAKDVVILISSGGNSQNMLNGAKKAREMNFKKIITFTGNDKNNKLNKLGDINFWIDSKAYNLVENAHQTLLLSIVDLIIGKSEYPPN